MSHMQLVKFTLTDLTMPVHCIKVLTIEQTISTGTLKNVKADHEIVLPHAVILPWQ